MSKKFKVPCVRGGGDVTGEMMQEAGTDFVQLEIMQQRTLHNIIHIIMTLLCL